MEEKDDIFRFEDFLGGNKIEQLKKMKSELLKEGVLPEGEEERVSKLSDIYDDSEEDEELDPKFNPYNTESDDEDQLDDVMNNDIEFDTDDIIEDEIDDDNKVSEDLDQLNDHYKLFKDKSEDFICDIAVEGVNQNDTEVRLIIESNDWTLMFKGEIKNGKCIIPIKKLNILNEGQTGNIKLEVNADGNLFTPWEDKYVVKVSKKVTVNVSESKSNNKQKPIKKKGLGVKVNVKK